MLSIHIDYKNKNQKQLFTIIIGNTNLKKINYFLQNSYNF